MAVSRSVLVVPLALLVACQGAGSPDTAPRDTPQAAANASPAADPGIIPLEQVKRSQHGRVMQRVATTDIEVVYNRPVARGRELFGALVPFGQVWNPGADEATAIEFSRNVMLEGQPLPAGKYSIWAIPGAADWTVIFSKAADVFHTPYPGEQHDALRVTIIPQAGMHVETLAFYFPVVEGKEAVLHLHWGETIVPMGITVP